MNKYVQINVDFAFDDANETFESAFESFKNDLPFARFDILTMNGGSGWPFVSISFESNKIESVFNRYNGNDINSIVDFNDFNEFLEIHRLNR